MDLFIIGLFLQELSFDHNLLMTHRSLESYRHFADIFYFINKLTDKIVMDINCVHFDTCSGCALNRRVNFPAHYIEAQKFFHEKGIPDLKIYCGAVSGWRCRAKLAVRGNSINPLIGLFKEGSHEVVEIPQCRVHHPSINRAIEIIRQWMIEEGVDPYNEQVGGGLLRYVQITVDPNSSKAQVVLVYNIVSSDQLTKTMNSSLESLWRGLGTLGHSLWLNFNARKDNLIFDQVWSLFAGEEFLRVSLFENEISFHPASFVQANLEMFKVLLDHVRDSLQKKKVVTEFYAGVGAIGFSLLEFCDYVRCVEIVPIAKRCFEETLKRLPTEYLSKISFIAEGAERQTALIELSDVVIVDPPRKGLDHLMLKALCGAKRPEQLIYISCGWSSFKRDCEKLLQSGWIIDKAAAFLFFPGSEHIEILAIFKNNNK